MNKIKQFITSNPVASKYFFFQFLMGLHFISAVTLPFFTEWGGLTFAQTMILQSWFSFWVFALEVPTGAVADFISRKASISLGALITILAAALYGSYPSFYIFLAAEFLWAMGYALQSGAGEAWLYDSLVASGKKKQAKKMIGQAHSFFLGGMLAAGLFGGLIAQKFGLNAPFLFEAGVFFIAFLVTLSFKEPAIDTQEPERQRYLQIIKKGWQQIRQSRKIRLIMLDAIVVAISAYYVIWVEQAVLQKVGVPLKWFGVVHSLMVLTEIAVSSQFDWFDQLLFKIEHQFKLKLNYTQFSALLTGVGFFIALLGNVWAAVLFIVLSGGFGLTRIKYLSAHLNHVVDSKQRATVLSVMSMLRRFLVMIINPAFGWLAQTDLNWALVAAGSLPLIVFFLPSWGLSSTTSQR